MIWNNTEEVIRQTSRFLKIVNKQHGLYQADAKFLSVKSNGSLDAEISQFRKMKEMTKYFKEISVR